MKLFPVHPVFWLSLLLSCASQSDTEAQHTDVCQDDMFPGDVDERNPPGQDDYVGADWVGDNLEKFRCLLYPKNTLNCSWSFDTLKEDPHLFVDISICDGNSSVPSLDLTSEDRVGSRSLILDEYESLYVVFHFNITQHPQWTVYTKTYDLEMLEVLPPPPNISASITDGVLLVTWGLPHTRIAVDSSCFEYQLDLGHHDQERYLSLSDQLSYSEPNPDPTYTYSVTMRTRKQHTCLSHLSQWSDWSPAIRLEQSTYKLNTLVIVSISLGIPMILLALLLLVRHQRITKVLFPPIPRPPQKYKYFLEKNETFNFFHSAPSAEPVEITEVEDTEQKPGKTS
ncbi:granulocyte-macrophage colony-stimulating factor receptor subunit alpha-like [Centropristis striata]|uniref:granulocyte-macrophage colony-stimulating factor receptor subunit alpha-like n=1 Tax=Centropristis striata TaxID=184440 RepID=UPI0027DFD8E1|nr:granulocyte-macrophage colony-stimulating factor receptor subunit alpha-like [Centropristis striata]